MPVPVEFTLLDGFRNLDVFLLGDGCESLLRHALFEKEDTLIAGHGSMRNGPNAAHKQSGTSQKRSVSQFLDDILLGVDGSVRLSTALRT